MLTRNRDTRPDWAALQAAIVDLDGTLVDTLGDFELALNAMLADLQLPPVTRALIRRLVGKGSAHLIRSVLLHQGVAEGAALDAAAAAGWASYQRHYAHFNGRASELYPGVLSGLDLLRARGLRLACLTNKPTGFARALLVQKGLAGFFAQVFGGDAFERTKPDPLPLRRTCAALGVAPQHTLMLGDSANDALAARGAGCPVLLVRYGYNHGAPVEQVDADGWMDALHEVPAA